MLMPLLSLGKEHIDTWISFDSLSIKKVRTVSLFKLNEKKEKILIEVNKYNYKGKIIESGLAIILNSCLL